MHSKRQKDAGLLTFVSLLYQIGGWWFLLGANQVTLAFFMFVVAFLLGIWGMKLRSMKDGTS